MTDSTLAAPRVGWIGTGRMGYEMAARLARGGTDVTAWNRTRAKAEPLAAHGVKIAAELPELAACEVVFVMVSTWDDVREVVLGERGLLAGAAGPAGGAAKTADGVPARTRLVVECSSISLEGSAELRRGLAARGIELLAAPVSGNAKVAKAGKLSFVCSGPRSAFDAARPLLERIGPSAAWVGEGELARIVKICHNVFLGVVTQSLAEVTVLAQKAGVPRHAFLDFINQSVLGSVFSRYKTPAFVNLDFKPTFTPQLLRKDLDLGLDAGRALQVPMLLASIVRDQVQALIGHGMDDGDFAKLLVLQARASGIELAPEDVAVGDGLGG